jgi:hypothetical protein
MNAVTNGINQLVFVNIDAACFLCGRNRILSIVANLRLQKVSDASVQETFKIQQEWNYILSITLCNIIVYITQNWLGWT